MTNARTVLAVLCAACHAAAQPDAGAELPSPANSIVMREAGKMILADPVDVQARSARQGLASKLGGV